MSRRRKTRQASRKRNRTAKWMRSRRRGGEAGSVSEIVSETGGGGDRVCTFVGEMAAKLVKVGLFEVGPLRARTHPSFASIQLQIYSFSPSTLSMSLA